MSLWDDIGMDRPPQRWVWAALFLLFLLIDFSLTLSTFADNYPKELFTFSFWSWALPPAFSVWCFALGVRIAWYALKQPEPPRSAEGYVSWEEPSPPTGWVWAIVFVVFLVTNIALTLLNFAQAPQQAISSAEFWGWALVPGISSWLIVFGLRLAWYALWSMHAAVNEERNEADRVYGRQMRREQAHVLHRVLLGPPCITSAERLQLLNQATPPLAPIADVGVLKIMGIAPKQSADRCIAIAQRIANQVATGLSSQRVPKVWVWSGSMTTWTAFALTLKEHGYRCPKQPHQLGGIEAVDWIIDRLHDENDPQSFILCAGLTVPETGTDTPLRSEVGFALLFGQHDGHVTIGRPKAANTADGLITIKTNAALNDDIIPFLSLLADKPNEVAKANWTPIDQSFTAYWHDTANTAPWVSLLMTCDWVQQQNKLAGWIAPTATDRWAGLVFPANPSSM